MRVDGVEVGVLGVFRKSTGSDTPDKCVEVSVTSTGHRVVRNSLRPGGAAVAFTPEEWTAFLDGAKGGQFDV